MSKMIIPEYLPTHCIGRYLNKNKVKTVPCEIKSTYCENSIDLSKKRYLTTYAKFSKNDPLL